MIRIIFLVIGLSLLTLCFTAHTSRGQTTLSPVLYPQTAMATTIDGVAHLNGGKCDEQALAVINASMISYLKRASYNANAQKLEEAFAPIREAMGNFFRYGFCAYFCLDVSLTASQGNGQSFAVAVASADMPRDLPCSLDLLMGK